VPLAVRFYKHIWLKGNLQPDNFLTIILSFKQQLNSCLNERLKYTVDVEWI